MCMSAWKARTRFALDEAQLRDSTERGQMRVTEQPTQTYRRIKRNVLPRADHRKHDADQGQNSDFGPQQPALVDIFWLFREGGQRKQIAVCKDGKNRQKQCG